MTDPTGIHAWLRYDDRLTSSGQPTEAQLAELPAIGVRHVVNLGLHTHERALADEAASVAALGMVYTHIPVAFDAPTEADFKAFVAAMADIGDAPVHVHCILNWRASAFLYRYRRDVLGVGEPEARAMMERLWRPGGVWAAFVGDVEAVDLPHRATLEE